MSADEDRWEPSEIPEHKRDHMYVDAEGYMTLNLSPSPWVSAGEGRDRVAQSLGVDIETAAAAIHTRLVSGHIIASAGAVFGVVAKRERLKLTGGRDMIPNNHWQWIKPTDSLWLLGDLQMRVLGANVAALRSVTYTDVRFLEPNISALTASAKKTKRDAIPHAIVPARGRPRGTGFDRSDAPLVEEILSAVAAGTYPSPTQAAQAIAKSGRAQGQSLDAIVDRLVRKAKKAELTGINCDPD